MTLFPPDGPQVLHRAFVSPFHNPANRYTRHQIDDFEALGLRVGTIREALMGGWGVPRSAKMLVLNWYEDRLAMTRRPGVEFFRSLLILCLLKMRIKHIIWVRHNLRPHVGVARDRLQGWFLAAIGRLVSVAVSHRAVAGMETMVVPHPLYESAAVGAVRDIPFLLPGTVRENKGVLELLERWPAVRALTIAGYCANADYETRIHEMIRARGLDVIWTNAFVEDAALDDLFARSAFVLLTNREGTMIVSGVFYHAASFGANVLIRPGAFGDAMAARYSFVAPLDTDRLDVPTVSPEIVMAEIESSNGRAARLAAWAEVFRHLGVTAARA